MDIMVDLETMGNNPNAAICAIGAVEFDIAKQTIGKEFYVLIDLEDSVKQGSTMDVGTVLWWLKQDEAARSMFLKKGIALWDGLTQFNDYVSSLGSPMKDIKMWGNGSAFDNVVLTSAYTVTDLPKPWLFWNDRCYRTMKNMYSMVPVRRIGTHHNALEDAKTQAQHMLDIYKFLTE